MIDVGASLRVSSFIAIGAGLNAVSTAYMAGRTVQNLGILVAVGTSPMTGAAFVLCGAIGVVAGKLFADCFVKDPNQSRTPYSFGAGIPVALASWTLLAIQTQTPLTTAVFLCVSGFFATGVGTMLSSGAQSALKPLISKMA